MRQNDLPVRASVAVMALLALARPALADDAPVVAFGPAPTDGGHFLVMATPELLTVRLNRLESFVVTVQAPDRTPVEGCDVAFEATVQLMTRRLPTSPRMVAATQGGHYRIDGIRFDMPGKWDIDIAPRCGALSEHARFELDVGPAP